MANAFDPKAADSPLIRWARELCSEHNLQNAESVLDHASDSLHLNFSFRDLED